MITHPFEHELFTLHLLVILYPCVNTLHLTFITSLYSSRVVLCQYIMEDKLWLYGIIQTNEMDPYFCF